MEQTVRPIRRAPSLVLEDIATVRRRLEEATSERNRHNLEMWLKSLEKELVTANEYRYGKK